MKLTKKILNRARNFRNKIVGELFEDTEYMLKKKSKFKETQEIDGLDSDDSKFSELDEELENHDKTNKMDTDFDKAYNEKTIFNIKRKNILQLITRFTKETRDKAMENLIEKKNVFSDGIRGIGSRLRTQLKHNIMSRELDQKTQDMKS